MDWRSKCLLSYDNNAELMYDTSPPLPNNSRNIFGDGSTKKVEFVGKINPIFYIKN